jgi:hypothetical protein
MRLQIPWRWYLCIKVLQAVRPVATDTLYDTPLRTDSIVVRTRQSPHLRHT